MHLHRPSRLAGAVLFALATWSAAAHAQADVDARQAPAEVDMVIYGDGPSPAPSQDAREPAMEAGTSNGNADGSFGGAIFNPFAKPAEVISPAPAAAPAHPTVAAEPKPEHGSIKGLALGLTAGAALMGWGLHRRRSPGSRRRA